MRYIKIPHPVKLRVVPGTKPEDVPPPTLSLLELVRDVVGGRAEWRENDSAVALYLDIVEALDGVEPGLYAKLTDEQHELLVKTMRALGPQGEFIHPYMRLMRAVTSASSCVDAPANGVEETARA